MCDCVFYTARFDYSPNRQRFLFVTWLVPRETTAVPAQVLCTPYKHARGWNGYRNKSQHRKLTLKKKILRCTCRESNPRPFDHKSVAVPASQRLLRFICFRAHSLRSIRIRLGMIRQHTARLEYPRKWLQRCLNFTWLMPREIVAVSAHVLCTPYIHTPVYSVTSFEAVAVVVVMF